MPRPANGPRSTPPRSISSWVWRHKVPRQFIATERCKRSRSRRHFGQKGPAAGCTSVRNAWMEQWMSLWLLNLCIEQQARSKSFPSTLQIGKCFLFKSDVSEGMGKGKGVKDDLHRPRQIVSLWFSACNRQPKRPWNGRSMGQYDVDTTSPAGRLGEEHSRGGRSRGEEPKKENTVQNMLWIAIILKY